MSFYYNLFKKKKYQQMKSSDIPSETIADNSEEKVSGNLEETVDYLNELLEGSDDLEPSILRFSVAIKRLCSIFQISPISK